MHDRAGWQEVGMSSEDNKRAVADFVERCQNQHDLDFADEIFHPEFVNHYRPEGRPIPETARSASGFQAFYGALLLGFPDAAVEINEQLAERGSRRHSQDIPGRGRGHHALTLQRSAAVVKLTNTYLAAGECVCYR
jgi:hypothetical protein